jgi:hypothetical protein
MCYPFLLEQPKQTKSIENIFIHTNKNPDFLAMTQPFQAIYSLLESARCKLPKAWHHFEKGVGRRSYLI